MSDGAISELLPWLDAKKRQAARGIADAMANPQDTIWAALQQMGQNLGVVATPEQKARDKDLESVMYSESPAGKQSAKDKIAEAMMGMGSGGIGVAGIMAGVGAKTANIHALRAAKGMERQGLDPTAIWQETGWTNQFPDKKWRFEISDDAAKFKPDFNAMTANKSNDYQLANNFPVGSLVDHPELFSAYPKMLDKLQVNIGKLPDWMPDSSNRGMISWDNVFVRNKTEPGAMSSMLHELQHSVQAQEGFAQGGTPEQFMKTAENPDAAFRMYRQLPGEVEARLAQLRQGLTAQQRQDAPPWWIYDWLKQQP